MELEIAVSDLSLLAEGKESRECSNSRVKNSIVLAGLARAEEEKLFSLLEEVYNKNTQNYFLRGKEMYIFIFY